MTAKEYVKNVYPKAKPERQKTNGGEVYWLIRPELHAMYISSGKTQLNAWVNAKKSLIAKSCPINLKVIPDEQVMDERNDNYEFFTIP